MTAAAARANRATRDGRKGSAQKAQRAYFAARENYMQHGGTVGGARKATARGMRRAARGRT